MTDLETKSSELNSAVYKNFIGYIPKAFINLLDDEGRKACEALDNIIYIDDQLKLIQYQSEHSLAIIAKVELNRNCFKLVEYRSVLDELSFSYLVKKYFERLKDAMSYSHLFMSHVDELTSEKNLQMKYLFPLQNQSFYSHIIEVEEISSIKSESIRTYINSITPEQKHLYSVPLKLIENYESTELAKPTLILGNKTSLINDLKTTEILSSINLIKDMKSTFSFPIIDGKTNGLIDLRNLHKDFQRNTSSNKSNEEIESKSKITPPVKPFRDFIRHNNKIEIENIIKNHFSDLKGVSLRYLIEYLIEKKVLVLNHGDKSILYNCFKSLFDNADIGTYNSIFCIQNFSKGDSKYKDSKNVYEEIFTNIFSQE